MEASLRLSNEHIGIVIVLLILLLDKLLQLHSLILYTLHIWKLLYLQAIVDQLLHDYIINSVLTQKADHNIIVNTLL